MMTNEEQADAYERGRRDERADVVAWMRYAAEWERGHATHADSPRLDYALTLDSAANQIRDGRHNQTTPPIPSSAGAG